jgi:alkylhydroperoxidase/carboxymuconolactone decarboxylase family protein YurZ
MWTEAIIAASLIYTSGYSPAGGATSITVDASIIICGTRRHIQALKLGATMEEIMEVLKSVFPGYASE